MKSFLFALIAAVSFTSMTAISPVQAEDKVVARVDGKDITEAQIDLADNDIGAELSNVPADQKRAVLLEFLIEHQLLANEAEKAKLAKGEEFEQRLAYYRRRAMRDAFFENGIRDQISIKAAEAIYKDQVKGVKPEIEVHARHILVKEEKEAKELVKELANGGDFIELAKKKSKGPSAANGGDLGYFTKGRMVKAFEEAAFPLKKGEISAPVKTKFGWHIIKVEDKRARPVPGFDDVKDRIMASLIQRKAQDVVAKLQKDGKIEVLDETLAKQREALRRGSFGGAQPRQ